MRDATPSLRRALCLCLMTWAVLPVCAQPPQAGKSSAAHPAPALATPSGQAGAQGVLPWQTLAQVDLVKQNGRYGPRFSPEILALADKLVTLRGFMMPLEPGGRQKHILLTATAPTCAYCMPGGPESVVEVKLAQSVKYGFEPLVVSGRLQVLQNDPMGLYYRLSDATIAK